MPGQVQIAACGWRRSMLRKRAHLWKFVGGECMFNSSPTCLVTLLIFRYRCLDEAQMIDGGHSNAAGLYYCH